ncbi:hypothetical protein D3C87_2046110 [compost metagenome]
MVDHSSPARIFPELREKGASHASTPQSERDVRGAAADVLCRPGSCLHDVDECFADYQDVQL